MRNCLLGFMLSICSLQWGVAQQFEADTTEEEPILSRLDSFLKDYNYANPQAGIYDTLLFNTMNFRSGEVPHYSNAVIQKRLGEIPSGIPLHYNAYVQRYIDVYANQRRAQVSRMLGLQKVYFPIFEEELDRVGLPMELKFLPIVESALNPHARSPVGATGLWQFMYKTAQEYNLKINSFVDERKDPFKSTQAAARYLHLMYQEFNDWHLAIAAYNCGPGNVRKAILRSGGKRTFWEIWDFLPRETRWYVPAYIAAVYTFYYAPEHNLYPVYADLNFYQDTLHLSYINISLEEISALSKTDPLELRNLNPHLKLGRIPYSSEAFVLRVPFRVAEYFALHKRELSMRYGVGASSAYFAANAISPSTSNASLKGVGSPTGIREDAVLVFYTVRSGDIVGSIAEKYNVSPLEISRWNALQGYRIRPGQKLKIYTDKSIAEKKAKLVTRTSTTSVANTGKSVNGPVNTSYHTVKSGDTLWGLAKKYTSGSVQALLSLNNDLDSRSKLQVGQSIRVK